MGRALKRQSGVIFPTENSLTEPKSPWPRLVLVAAGEEELGKERRPGRCFPSKKNRVQSAGRKYEFSNLVSGGGPRLALAALAIHDVRAMSALLPGETESHSSPPIWVRIR